MCTDAVTASDVPRDGHLDRLVRMAIAAGVEPVTAIQMATLNCAQMYRIDHLVGAIAPGRIADVLVVDSPESFNVMQVIANGRLAAVDAKMMEQPTPPQRSEPITESFRVPDVSGDDLRVRVGQESGRVRVLAMEMTPEVAFVRKRRAAVLEVRGGSVLPDIEQDVLYVAVVERYGKSGKNRWPSYPGSGWRRARWRRRPPPTTTSSSAWEPTRTTWRSRSTR